MAMVDAKTLIAFAAGAVVALTSWGLGSASASTPQHSNSRAPASVRPAAATPVVTRACANKVTGVMAVISTATKKKKCAKTEVLVAWAPPTPSLLAKDKTLRLVSPNGKFVLVINNSGIGLKGPGGSFVVDSFNVTTYDGAGRKK